MARRRSRFVRPAPKTVMWIGAGVGTTTIVASSVQLIGQLAAGALLLRPFTILRTRQQILYTSDQAAVTQKTQGDYGRIVVTDTASAIGATAIPDPSSIDGDPEADWYVHQPCMVQFDFLSSVGFHPNAGVQYTIDSKAMRKVGPDDDVVSMFSETDGDGGFLTTRGRMLIQLH